MTPPQNDSEYPVGEGRLKFSIFLRRDGMLIELFAINRTPTGLYFNATQSAMGRSRHSSSYHESGLRWSKGLGNRNSYKIKDAPLYDFRGQFSLTTSVHNVIVPSAGRPETDVNLRQEDIVFERPGIFGVEIILSDVPIELPSMADRPNSVTFTRDQAVPIILVEVFDVPSAVFPLSRYPRRVPLVEGETLFFDHPDPI